MARGLKRETTAIITGASTGIGRALAHDLAKKYQARLALNARGETGLEEVRKQIEQLGGKAVTVCGDIGNPETRAALLDKCKSEFGPVDILINNAGLATPGPMTRISLADWRRVFDVNVFAAVDLVYSLLPDFLERGTGKIVNIASVAGKLAFPGSVCYASSKFALTGFSEGMAAEIGPKGVDIITVCPGLVRTDFFKKNKNARDVTEMAKSADLQGWVLRNIISISSEQASREILAACQRGGCQEIVLTVPGMVLERLAGVCPPAAWWLSRFVPNDR